MAKKTARQLDADIATALAGRRAGARKKKPPHESPADRLKKRLDDLQGYMADATDDRGWLETDPYEIEKWISVDDELSDRAWFDAAKNQLVEQSVLPEHAGAPPENVRAWNDVFISTYHMNIDSGMSEQDAINSARWNANDTVPLEGNEHSLTKTDPKLYKRRW